MSHGLDIKCKLFADDLKLYATRANNHYVAIDDVNLALKRIESWCDLWQLKLAPDKCSVLHISTANHSPQTAIPYSYIINSKPIKACPYIRDLGVIVDNRLKFSQHISNITRTALTRAKLILKCFISRDKDLLVKAFITYVRPILEYCSPVWSPHHQYLINKVEHVQRFFTKRIRGLWNIPYEDRLSILGLRSLEYRRIVGDLSMCYQILHGVIKTSFSNCFTININLRTRGHDKRIFWISFSKDIGKYWFINRTIKVWNKLPEHAVHAQSLSSFKYNLSQLSSTELGIELIYY